MKKIIYILIAVLILNGCTDEKQMHEKEALSKLTVWSFSSELEGMITSYYKKAHPDIAIDFVMVPTADFTEKLDPTLASGIRTPDVFALEDAFVRKYVESGLLLDISDIYEANKTKLLTYPVQVGSFNNKVYAMSWQATPGAVFYRRSLAQRYLGTDDPVQVQTYFSNLDAFLATAALLKEHSNGSCVVVSSHVELLRPYLGFRKQPWVVNDSLVIDPIMEDYMDMARTLWSQGFEGRVNTWSDAWIEGMKGTRTDENGHPVEVFSYFIPTWGLHYLLKSNAPETSGDWAMIPGPIPYRWGGTWICAWKNSKNPDAAKEMIRYFTTDDVFLETYAKASGDLVSNITVVDKIKGSYSEPFLKGQNHYAAFAEMAKGINGELIQGTDLYIEGIFDVEVEAFASGEKSKAQALADFRNKVARQIGY